MPRILPPLAAEFRRKVLAASSVARAGDLAATAPIGTSIRTAWHVSRVELLYELAFLRIFIEWEVFLERTFLRYLCGYRSRSGAAFAPTSGRYCSSISSAQTLILGNRSYLLWHSPTSVATRARAHLALSPHETVITSATSQLTHMAAVRHRIAHGQEDAKAKFDAATMALVGRRYIGARAGRFLRDWDRSVAPNVRWLEALSNELASLATQIE